MNDFSADDSIRRILDAVSAQLEPKGHMAALQRARSWAIQMWIKSIHPSIDNREKMYWDRVYYGLDGAIGGHLCGIGRKHYGNDE